MFATKDTLRAKFTGRSLLRRFVSMIVVLPMLVQWPVASASAATQAPTLEQRITASLLALSPLDQRHEDLPGWSETPEERRARYVSIASDVAAVVTAMCRSSRCNEIEVASHLIGVAWHESGFAPDVDLGPCYLGPNGKWLRCDGGRAVSLWQIRTGGEEREEVSRDRRAAAHLAARKIARSLGACRSLPKPLRLSAYAGGRCSDQGRAARASEELSGAVARAYQIMITTT